ncbi:MAG: hypothetical protein CML81_01305 [Rhodobiaceae bacterium]|nr:hypothetical protein [Rhodobiaceae bacterium]RPF97689.1 MAG: hypothetical protein CBD87_001295 [Rhizobiales bacterium TMED227]|tara:strand:+ start:8884 stop:9834 length:951 start_codon:yes stop_codon:yes gene_type:complete
MAVVRPVYFNNGNIQQMDDTMFGLLKDVFRYQFQQTSPITLSVVNSGGNLSGLPMVDTRMQAGASLTRVERFSTEAETAEPTQLNINYSRISQTISSAPTLGNDDGKRYFCYIDNNNEIKVMNHGDMLDTIVRPVIDELTAATTGVNQAGTYFINNSSSIAGNQSLVSSTPVFVDTRADLAAYTASGIGETQDQPTTINNYYLKKNVMNAPTLSVLPVQIRSDNQLQEFTTGSINTIASELMRIETINSSAGYKIRYNINGSGNNRGSGMADTRLTGGSGNYQTRYVNTNDYRAQEFPDGTATTINTYYLKIEKSF